MQYRFGLRCDKSEIPDLFESYDPSRDALPREEISPKIRLRGYCRWGEFIQICSWKSPRTKRYTKSNSAELVKFTTRLAYSSPCEQLRIEVLTLLKGVSWPVASALLHWGYQNKYPILDFRALWSLGFDEPPTYNFEFWKAYRDHCTNLAQELGLSIRELDRALWMYSKDNQKK